MPQYTVELDGTVLECEIVNGSVFQMGLGYPSGQQLLLFRTIVLADVPLFEPGVVHPLSGERGYGLELRTNMGIREGYKWVEVIRRWWLTSL